MTLASQLDTLEVSGLIQVAQTEPELEYLFRHTLVQETAYRSLLRQDRKHIHRAVGEALESLYPERLDQIAPVLGHHFYVAGDDRRACKYFTLAGDVAMSAYANAEAISHFSQALELAKGCQVSCEELTHLYTCLGRTLELNSHFDRALAAYKEMEKLAGERGDRALELAALMAQIPLRATANPVYDPVQAQTLGERALGLADELSDLAARARILWNLTVLHMYTGRSDEAAAVGEQSLTLARELDLREQMAFTLNDLARCYWMIGRFDRAKLLSSEAQDLWREFENLPMLADSLSLSCSICVLIGEYDQAMAYSEKALQISKSTGNLWGQSYSQYMVGRAYWERGQSSRAIAIMEDSIRLSESIGFLFPQVLTRVALAIVYHDLGAVERSLETARLALTVAETHLPIFRVHALTVLALLYLLNDDLIKAEDAINAGNKYSSREAWSTFVVPVKSADAELALRQGDYKRGLVATDALLADLRQWGMRSQIPGALHLQAQILLAMGRQEAARERLLKARTEAEAIGSRRSLWPILAALSRLESDPTEGERLRQSAQEIIQYIVDHTDAPELKASFLGLPQVQAVLNG